jgi:hypothetical protein
LNRFGEFCYIDGIRATVPRNPSKGPGNRIISRKQPLYRIARDKGARIRNQRQYFRPVQHGGWRLSFARNIEELRKKIFPARFENAQQRCGRPMCPDSAPRHHLKRRHADRRRTGRKGKSTGGGNTGAQTGKRPGAFRNTD